MATSKIRPLLEKARKSERLNSARSSLARNIAPAEKSDGFSGYGEWWKPTDDTHAMQLVLNETDPEIFEQSGKNDAAIINELVNPGDTVMDVGCGIGRVARYVAAEAGTLWAVDASTAMLAMAKQRLADLNNVQYAVCNDTSIPDVPTDSVDVVYSVLVLQHMDRDDAFRLLTDIRRVLKPTGRALFTFPNLMSETYLSAFVRHALDHDNHPGRARYYTPQEVGQLLPAAGFGSVELVEEVEIRAVCRPK